MGTCELCGIDRKTRTIKEEEAIIDACYICVPDTSKDVHIRTIPAFREKRSVKPNIPIKTYELVDGYGRIIRTSRELKGMTIEEFAKKLNISTGYYHKIEKEQIKPDEKTIKIIEKNIKKTLTTFVEAYPDKEENNDEETSRNEDLTLGGIFKSKLKGFNVEE